MQKYLLMGTLSLAASAMLVGCGGSDTTEVSSNLETGYFIDAPVEGLAYETQSGQRGTTDQYGRFQYKNGEKVRFMIGKLDLGEAVPDQEGLVTPETIAPNDEALKVQILRLLQALDSDNDPSNGITISQDVVASLSELNTTVQIEDIASDEQILGVHEKVAEKLDTDYDGKIDVAADQAEAHFANSITNWQNGHKPDTDATTNANGQSYGQGHGNGNGNGQGQGQGNGQGHGTGANGGNMGTFDLNQYPTSTLTQEVKDALAYMGNEERLAYDIYMNLYDFYAQQGVEIRQFQNIAERSESRHIAIVQDLVRRYDLGAQDVTNVQNPVADNSITQPEMPRGTYDVPAIQELYDTLYAKGIQSAQDALEVGCMVEVTDINDLNERIANAEEANATDVVAGFEILRSGSYNHYWAFDKGLKNMGVAEGCGVLGEAYAKTEAEYPKSH